MFGSEPVHVQLGSTPDNLGARRVHGGHELVELIHQVGR